MLVIPPDAVTVLAAVQRRLTHRGEQGYLVGGAVRDALLGRDIDDIDVAVAGDPGPLADALRPELGASVVVLDAKRRIFRLVLGHGRPVLDLTPLDGNLDEDAQRRDFTIDALAVPLTELVRSPQQAPVIDVVGGMQDLRRRTVRAVADGVFREDGARLLRAVRLAAELDFEIEEQTASLISRDAGLLRSVAPERVRDEFCRILGLPGAGGWLGLLDRLGLLTRILPELEAARGVTQPKEHYWDVLQHSMETVAAVERVLRSRLVGNVGEADPDVTGETPWDDDLARYFAQEVGGGHTRGLLLKLAALLHDVAKPATKTIEPDGRIRFLGHPSLGARMTQEAMERLRFGNRETRAVVTLVKEHLRPGLISRDGGPSRRALYRFFRDAGDVVVETLFLSLADLLAARGPLLEADDWRRYAEQIRGMLDNWRDQGREARPPKLIDGHDLMRALDLAPGPHVGYLLDAVREAHAAGELSTPDEAFALARRLNSQGSQHVTPRMK